MGALFSQPWRPMPKTNEENLDFVKCYRPRNNDVNQLRILLHGPVGAGKSSFINSVDSVLQGRVTGRALTDETSGSSFTKKDTAQVYCVKRSSLEDQAKKYKTYTIQKDPDNCFSFVFNDIMGFEQKTDNGVHVEDVTLALKGHVNEGYKFIPECHLSEGDLGYNSSPTLAHKVHVLVSVIPADSGSLLSDEVLMKMRAVRLAASDMGIPQLAILTKADRACPKVKKDINNIYKSKYLKKKVDEFSVLVGLPLNCIFLVKNYESEFKTSEGIDAPILCALRQMISFGEDYLNNL